MVGAEKNCFERKAFGYLKMIDLKNYVILVKNNNFYINCEYVKKFFLQIVPLIHLSK